MRESVVSRLMSTAALTMAALVFAQPPPPPAPPAPPGRGPRTIEERIEDIRRRIAMSATPTAEQKELKSFAETYLNEAMRALSEGHRFQAQQLADAADACRRPMEHLDHIDRGRGPGPPPRDLEDRLRQAYFRLRLSEFFLKQLPPPTPKRLLDLAREFYERGMRAEREGNTSAADEYTKSCDDLTHALESLAQAAFK